VVFIFSIMQNLQDIFNRIQETKYQEKGVKAVYREALAQSTQYQELLKKIQTLREEKKKIEAALQGEYRSELTKLDEIKSELESNRLLLSDMAINEMVKGNSIEVTDKYANKYEPVFSVRFKKAG